MARDSKLDTRHGIFQDFFRSEVSGSIVLLACTVLAGVMGYLLLSRSLPKAAPGPG